MDEDECNEANSQRKRGLSHDSESEDASERVVRRKMDQDEWKVLAMRSPEGKEAQVCYFIIQLLLLKPNDFSNRVSDFGKENAPEHWLQSDWHTKHMTYH
ncbi:mediator of RNA polymerase II transcription subunit 23-like [Carassius auratus]|uniref:Mediator of RNA polymerase II transcription subunit 23 n=1 Tax=Carassius auratus TaxID=7957 RepID=A0A6P6LYY6_CARAU|nr:mediator of RNA polymerase II transcription subunit 23-like [Carassius auratus]